MDIDVSRCSAQWCHPKEPMCKSMALPLDFKNPAWLVWALSHFCNVCSIKKGNLIPAYLC